jgi:pimeloyl-ACP methyl ester carboxylesterase
MARLRLALLLLIASLAASAQSICDPDGVQASGSKYRICMPPAGSYNGHLIVWAHGFQDAGTPVQIPEDQLCFSGLCLNELANGLGFGFATNSYSKTGLAIVEGRNDILDLVNIYKAQKGTPTKVYLVGASEGGIITALALEQNADVFSAGVAACGPIGDFPMQINYFGDARATFEYFFPGVIPGPPFAPPDVLVQVWSQYYDLVVKPWVMDPSNRTRLDEWVRVAALPYDPADYLGTVETSVKDVLRYSVVNLNDAAQVLGGMPFDNMTRYYAGSSNDALLNATVPRIAAAAAALAAMNGNGYRTTGQLTRPLITIHTTLDQQVPYLHHVLYALKTIGTGDFISRHLPIEAPRYEHCNFTTDEVILAFILMLVFDNAVQEVSGLASKLEPAQLGRIQKRLEAAGIPYRIDGPKLELKLQSKQE